MSIILPKFIALQVESLDISVVLPKFTTSQVYLRSVQSDNSPLVGILSLTEPNILSPYAKHEVIHAGGGLVHIRGCYNNKYWVARDSGTTTYIAAAADEPEEDQSLRSCTLFQPVFRTFGSSTTEVRFRHVNLNEFAYPSTDVRDPAMRSCLLLGGGGANSLLHQNFTFTDLELLVVLPKYVAFRAGDNDMYLRVQTQNGKSHLLFSSSDKGDERVLTVVTYNDQGRAQIMSNYNKMFWRHDSGDADHWILADASLPTHSFWPVQFADNRIGLRSPSNSLFCKRFTNSGITGGLSATAPTSDEWSRLRVEELVESRSIYDTIFHLKDARRYGETILTLDTHQSFNSSSEPTTATLEVTYENSRTSTWNNSHSWTAGVSTTFTVGIPLIAKTEIEVSASYTGTYDWGTAITETETRRASIQVTVSPGTVATMRMLVSRAQCDVPFSYYQRDRLHDGTAVIEYKEDGIYSGVNSYDFWTETEERPLTAFEIQQQQLLLQSTSADDQTERDHQKLPLSSE